MNEHTTRITETPGEAKTYPSEPRQAREVHEDTTQCMNRERYDFCIESITGECITSGWFFDEGPYYVAEEKIVQELCQRIYGCSIEEVHEDNDELVYYTEWDEEV